MSIAISIISKDKIMENKLIEEIKKVRKEKNNRDFVNTFVKRGDIKELSTKKGFGNVSEFLYVITNNISKKPFCRKCGEEVEFINITKGYRKFCSVKCSKTSKETQRKLKETCLERYGVESPSQNEKVKNKTKETCLERYGVENPSQNEEVKQKKLRKHLLKTPEELNEIKKKKIKTNLKKYGKENYFQTDEFKNNNDFSLSYETKEKIRKTCLEKYGVPCSLQNDQVKEKIRKTCLERYGVENPSQSEIIKEKVKNTNLEKFGVENCLVLPEVVESSKKTNFERAILRRANFVKPLFEYNEYDGVLGRKEYLWECVKCGKIFKSHMDNGRIPRCFSCSPTIITFSQPEYEVKEFIKELGFDVRKKRYSKFEIDILIEEKNIGFELDGLYWHSEIGGGKSPSYHIEKTNYFKDFEIEVFHIFEDEWNNKKDIVKSIIKNKLGIIDKKIYARKCKVRELPSRETKSFFSLNHIQGHINSSINLGLFFENELVSVLSFSKSRFEKDTLEITRFANLLNTSVIGGFSKLFSYFRKNFQYERVVTYSDIRYFNGDVYRNNGFDFIGKTSPNYFYMLNYKERINRMHFQKHKLKNLLESFEDGKTEWENMQENKYDRIWDCGNYKFEFTENNLF